MGKLWYKHSHNVIQLPCLGAKEHTYSTALHSYRGVGGRGGGREHNTRIQSPQKC